MAILIDSDKKVLVQGMTGREGKARTKLMLDYGTKVVAGCTPGRGGLTPADKEYIAYFKWNDPQSLQDCFSTHKDDVAAICVTPFHHPLYIGSEFATEAFIDQVHELRDRHGCLLVVDDIRAGFRMHLGGSHRSYGWLPDLACYSKATNS